METMYDRLGDLLNETLQAGHVKFVKPKPAEETQEKKVVQEKQREERESQKTDGSAESKERADFKKKTESANFYRPEQKATGTIIKAIPPEVERACRLLGVNANATKEEVKKAYKEKLQYYHPDKHAGNPILEKVAGDKTRQVVEAYSLMIAFLER